MEIWNLKEILSGTIELDDRDRRLPIILRSQPLSTNLVRARISTVSPPKKPDWYSGGYCYQILDQPIPFGEGDPIVYLGERLHIRLGDNIIFPNTEFGEYKLEFIAPHWFDSLTVEIWENISFSIDDIAKNIDQILSITQLILNILGTLEGVPPLPQLPPSFLP